MNKIISLFIIFSLMFISPCLSMEFNNVDISGVDVDVYSVGDLVIGVFTDAHQQQAGDPGDYNNHSNEKLTLAATKFENIDFTVDFMVSLGDLIDSTVSAEDELLNLSEMETAFANFTGTKYVIIGNHEIDELGLNDFVSNSTHTPSSYWSTDISGFHCVFLNPNDAGGFFEMSSTQLTWLENDLSASSLPTIIFSHYRLEQDYPGDPINCTSGSTPEVDCYSAFAYNSDDIRAKLEADSDVFLVLQGHDHDSVYTSLNNIHYFTFTTMTNASATSSAYALVHVYDNKTVYVNGFGRELNYSLR